MISYFLFLLDPSGFLSTAGLHYCIIAQDSVDIDYLADKLDVRIKIMPKAESIYRTSKSLDDIK